MDEQWRDMTSQHIGYREISEQWRDLSRDVSYKGMNEQWRDILRHTGYRRIDEAWRDLSRHVDYRRMDEQWRDVTSRHVGYRRMDEQWRERCIMPPTIAIAPWRNNEREQLQVRERDLRYGALHWGVPAVCHHRAGRRGQHLAVASRPGHQVAAHRVQQHPAAESLSGRHPRLRHQHAHDRCQHLHGQVNE